MIRIESKRKKEWQKKFKKTQHIVHAEYRSAKGDSGTGSGLEKRSKSAFLLLNFWSLNHHPSCYKMKTIWHFLANTKCKHDRHATWHSGSSKTLCSMFLYAFLHAVTNLHDVKNTVVCAWSDNIELSKHIRSNKCMLVCTHTYI